MERRSLGAGLLVLLCSLFLVVGTAGARTVKPAAEETNQSAGAAGCIVKALPSSFIDQGEFSTSSSVATVLEVECNPEYAAESLVEVRDEELYERCDGRVGMFSPYELAGEGETEGELKGKIKSKSVANIKHDFSIYSPSDTVYTDNDGNATVVVLGEGCTAGETLVTADLVEDQYETVFTSFTVDAPRVTPPGLTITPAADTEDDYTSSAATIAEIEFPPVDAEKYVDINSPQLYDRCQYPGSPKLVWIGEGGSIISVGPDLSGEVQLDNDGNAFVVLVGSASCAAGTSLVEASLEAKPYTTYKSYFTINPPMESFNEVGV